MPGRCNGENFALLKNAAVRYPCARATLNTVEKSTTSFSAVATLFQSTPCWSGGSPLNIEVCDGSVLLGMIVRADNEAPPSRTSRCNVGALNRAMASGRSPSIDTSTTFLVIPTAGESVAVESSGPDTTYLGPIHPCRLTMAVKPTMTAGTKESVRLMYCE